MIEPGSFTLVTTNRPFLLTVGALFPSNVCGAAVVHATAGAGDWLLELDEFEIGATVLFLDSSG